MCVALIYTFGHILLPEYEGYYSIHPFVRYWIKLTE